MMEGPYKLPEGWRWVRLGEVVKASFSGGTPSTEVPWYWGGDIRWTTSASIAEEDVFLRTYLRTITQEGLERSSCRIAPVGSLIVATRVGVGKAAVATFDVAISQDLTALILSQDVDPVFLAYLFKSDIMQEQLQTRTRGATIKGISRKELLTALIPLPPLEEQRRIVARLEELMARVREAKRLRQQAKEDAERLMQAALAETFPRPGTEPPPGWRWVRLGEVAQVFSGTWGTDPTSADLDDRLLARVIRVSDVKETLTIDYDAVPLRSVSRREAKRLALRSGDVIVVKSSGSKAKVISGRAALFSKREELFLPSNFVFAVRGKREILHPAFLWHWLNAAPARQYIEQIVSTFTYPNLKKADYVKLPIPLPPLEEQRRIVAHLEAVQEKVRALKEAQAATDAELQRLEQAILDKAFRGEL